MVKAPKFKPFAFTYNSSRASQPRLNTDGNLFPGVSSKKNEKSGSGDPRPSPFQNKRSISPNPFSGPDKPRTG